MSTNTLLISLNLLVALFGLLLVAITVYEYSKLAKLRSEFEDFQCRLRADLYALQKAMQRVIASYHIEDPDSRIQLLSEALEIDPQVFNGYNALGYAYLEKEDVHAAIDAFREAIQRHPEDKEGYFDIARAYLQLKQHDRVRKYLKQASEVDVSALEDIKQDEDLRSVFNPA